MALKGSFLFSFVFSFLFLTGSHYVPDTLELYAEQRLGCPQTHRDICLPPPPKSRLKGVHDHALPQILILQLEFDNTAQH